MTPLTVIIARTDNDDSELQSQFTGSVSLEMLLMWYRITVSDGQFQCFFLFVLNV